MRRSSGRPRGQGRPRSALRPLPLLGLGQKAQAIDVARPHPPKVRLQRSQGATVSAIEAARAGPTFAYQACVLQHAQVLRDGGPADIERLGDLTGGQLLGPDEAQDLAPAWARKGG